MTDREDALLAVAQLNLPVETFRRSQQHHEALLREFALIGADAHEHTDAVPQRLLTLVRQLTQRFGGFSMEPHAQLRDAMDHGVERVDVHFRVPRTARDAAIALGDLLDEADEFCRNGDLLSLAAPSDVLAFRRRYLDEFVRQIDGAAPRPWPEP